jgi:aminopeptidase N
MNICKHICFFVTVLVAVSCSSQKTARVGKAETVDYTYPKFTQKDSLRGALNPFRTCYNVLHYTLTIDVNPQKKSIQGYVDMQFSVMQHTEKMQVDLFKNMTMDSIVLHGKRLKFERKYDAVFIQIPQLEIGKTETIRMYYKGKPLEAPRPPWEGGFVWKKDEQKNPWIGVACELVGASLWWPCKDHLSDEPEYGVTMNVTVPQGLTVVSNGKLLEQKSYKGKDTFTWQTKYTINNYNVTLYIGKFEHFSEKYKGIDTTITLDYYVLPEHLEKTKITFQQTSNILRYYESIYGPYPWPTEGFKLVGSPYEGMEHQTAIAYGTGFRTHHLGFDYIILHESAHEWWGNSISVDDFADIFIHEGFATYSEALFIEHTYGVKEAERYMYKYAGYIKNKNPIVGPRDVNFWDYKDTDPYMKGAWTLHGLRYVINNDSLFFDILKTYYNTRAYSVVTVKDFTDFVQQKSGMNLEWYFTQYLYSRHVPTLEYVAYKKDNIVTIEMRWANVQSNFALPVQIDLNGEPIRVLPSTEPKRFVFHNVTEIELNPYKAYFIVKKVESFK